MDRTQPSTAPPAPPPPVEPAARPRSAGSGLPSPERLRHELAQAQKMETIGQLASGITHDINDPLAAIVAFSQLIWRDPRLPDDLRDDAHVLVQEAERTRRIVQNVLDFARHRPSERRPADLRQLVDSVLDLQSYPLRAHGIEVEVEIEPDLPMISLDRPQMQQVLLNLTLNAIEALSVEGNGGHIRIHVARARRGDDTFVALSVSDDGPGVPDDVRDRLFMPFFTTKPPGEGSGLGLAVSADIVGAHGGRLHHEPGNAGRGAAFVLELRIGDGVLGNGASAAERPRRTTSETSAPERVRSQPAVSRARILVLDDEPSIRRFLSTALDEAGFEAVLAASGPEAIEIVRNGGLEGVLSDDVMGAMSGMDVYEAVVALRPELRDRFMFMTGDVLNADLRDFADEHGVGLLAKPFDLASVGRTVRDLVERTAAR